MPLDRCPRCHSENVVLHHGGGIAQIICTGTSLDACGLSIVRSTPAQAEEAWNWRAPVAGDPLENTFGVHPPAVKRGRKPSI